METRDLRARQEQNGTDINRAKALGETEGVVTKIYEGCLLAIEITVFFVKLFFAYLHGIYLVFSPPKERSVAGEIVLITGAGHGIGKELAKQYGELGAQVICVDINPETNGETVQQLTKAGVKAHMYLCDVSNRESVLKLGDKIRAEVGDVTILINNAGIMPCKRYENHKPEEIKKMFDINVFAHFWMLDAFLPRMLEKDHGHIVGISSVAGLVGSPNVTPYCASKFAVRGLMEALSEELRRNGKTNIKFTTIYPFVTDTGLCKKPKIRFQNLMKVLTPQQTAAAIVSAQRKGQLEASVPPFLLTTNTITRTMPYQCAKLIVDFLDSGLDPHD